MFELSFQYSFEAAHRFTQSCQDRCSTPHGHTWKATLHFSSLNALDSSDMISEFQSLKLPWRTFIQKTVDHSFLHRFDDPILPALKDHIPNFRGLPFPGDPTTELIAALFYEKALSLYRDEKTFSSLLLKIQAVSIYETKVNHIKFYPQNFSEKLINYNGWWQDKDPLSRDFKDLTYI